MCWSISASRQTSPHLSQPRTSSDAEMCIKRDTDSKAGGQVGICGNISCEPFLIISAVLTGNEWNRVWEGPHLIPSFQIHCLHTRIKCYLNGTHMPLGYPNIFMGLAMVTPDLWDIRGLLDWQQVGYHSRASQAPLYRQLSRQQRHALHHRFSCHI